jgi:hypothetical protein
MHEWIWSTFIDARCKRCDISNTRAKHLADINYIAKICLGNKNIPGQSDPNFINIYYPCISDDELIIKNIIK